MSETRESARYSSRSSTRASSRPHVRRRRGAACGAPPPRISAHPTSIITWLRVVEELDAPPLTLDDVPEVGVVGGALDLQRLERLCTRG